MPIHLNERQRLGLSGIAGLALTVYLLAQRLLPECGDRILGIWSKPHVMIAAILASISFILIASTHFLTREQTENLWQGLVTATFSFGLTIAVLFLAMRWTVPLRVQTPSFYVNHDALGYFFAPNLRYEVVHQHHNFRAVFTTDEQGLIIRGQHQLPDFGATRILFIGDSFMAGLQVMPEQNLSVRTEALLNNSFDGNYQTFNVGVDGYSPIQYYFAYESFKEYVDPEIVVTTIYVSNDFTDTVNQVLNDRVVYDETGRIVGMRPAIDTEQGLVWANPFAAPIPIEATRRPIVSENVWKAGPLKVLIDLFILPYCKSKELGNTPSVEASNTIAEEIAAECLTNDSELLLACPNYVRRNTSLIRNNKDAIFKDSYTITDYEDIDIVLSMLRRLAESVESDGGTLILVIIPAENQVPGQGQLLKRTRGLQPDEIITSTAPQDLLLTFCKEEQLDCIDLLPAFTANSDEVLYWPDDPHFTATGHELAANVLVELLEHLDE